MGIFKFNSRIVDLNGYPFGYAGAKALWTPTKITTELWLDASDKNTLTCDSAGRISVWRDKSGNGWNAVQTATSLQPIKTQRCEKSVVSFYGGRYLATDSWSPKTQPNYIILVIKCPIDDGVLHIIFDGNNTTNRHVFAKLNTGIFLQHAGADNKATIDNLHGNYAIIGLAFNGVSSSIRVNGSDSLLFTGDCGTQSSVGITLGARSNGNDYFIGECAEFIFLDSLPTTEIRQKLEGFLAWKWYLSESLPLTHPYKNISP
jgi:hypothetical protein